MEYFISYAEKVKNKEYYNQKINEEIENNSSTVYEVSLNESASVDEVIELIETASAMSNNKSFDLHEGFFSNLGHKIKAAGNTLKMAASNLAIKAGRNAFAKHETDSLVKGMHKSGLTNALKNGHLHKLSDDQIAHHINSAMSGSGNNFHAKKVQMTDGSHRLHIYTKSASGGAQQLHVFNHMGQHIGSIHKIASKVGIGQNGHLHHVATSPIAVGAKRGLFSRHGTSLVKNAGHDYGIH